MATNRSRNGGADPQPTRDHLGPAGDPAPERFGFHQSVLVSAATRTLILTGQVGRPSGDLEQQLNDALDKIHDLLLLAGMEWGDLVKLGIFTTDVDAFVGSWSSVRDRFDPATPVPPNTLVQVARFAHPDVLVEIDGIAMS